MEKDNKLDSRIEGNFAAVGVKPGEFIFKGTTYDLRRMDEATAEKLVKAECPYLKKKTTTAKSSK